MLYKGGLNHLDVVAPEAEATGTFVHERIVGALKECRITYGVVVIVVVILAHRC